ncbi:type II toxin-antitoxin system Phd/YefM family antitoxin [Andreprevotia chitinilytica]|uniref:type II toxin-antitoxin system Phd/YefM family antitoxin n=1 Tax=Andreprevotia chitinilytica TaxID=396808 RepID=UPI0005596A38|nr:type II toxin-antitoxin system prevent-host-death family antitoxin [Andreprevotia chitinilytica]
MNMVALAEAKAKLSQLVDGAQDGVETVIAKHGRPVAKLVPFSRPKAQRIGAMKGRLVVPDDFDQPLAEDELALFEGKL